MGPEDPDTLLKIFLHGKKTATENGDFIGVPNKNDKESGLLSLNFEACPKRSFDFCLFFKQEYRLVSRSDH